MLYVEGLGAMPMTCRENGGNTAVSTAGNNMSHNLKYLRFVATV